MYIPDQEVRKHLHKEIGPSELPLSEQRENWLNYARTLKIADGIEAREESLSGTPCLWLREQSPASGLTLLYLHGGGLVDGAIVTHREFASRLAKGTSCRVLMVGYRLAPEHPFPAALDDVVAVYRCLVEEKGIDPGKIAFGGDSSGGGLAISALMGLRDEGYPLPRCAFAISGVFDMTLSGESMTTRNQVDPCLSREALVGWLEFFQDFKLDDPLLSPLFGDVQGLPPILLVVGDHEVWRDDSTRMARRIKECRGDVTLQVWDSMWHVWPMYAELKEAAEAIEAIRSFLVDPKMS